MKSLPRAGSFRRKLLESSKEAALAATQIFNNPLITFKTESFLMLMVVAWTYLLHAYYDQLGVDCRYYEMKGKRKVYVRIDRRPRTWELSRCLREPSCPLDVDTVNNLKFLIGLRNEVEHIRATELDTYLSGRYQACALNYNHYLTSLFGMSIDSYLAYSIQFSQLSSQQAKFMTTRGSIPQSIKSFILRFDEGLTQAEADSERFSYRLLFQRRLAGKPGQADSVIEFLSPDSELAAGVPTERWVSKEVEKPKYRPTGVVKMAREAGFVSFTVNQHAELWRRADAKNPAKGFGCDVSGY
jgi:hypothetical protein